jgi:5-oxoprolinase (ATP-hydrolysing) subunit C
MAFIRIQRPGMFTTVQDLGRPGCSAMGVPEGGAADTLSLRIGNRLVGNSDSAAALEMTMTGAAIAFEEDATVAIVGGACDITLTAGGSGGAIAQEHTNTPIAVPAGSTLAMGPIRHGIRAYLCISGGVAVPALLGSASTHISAGFGGLEGRALRSGDRIAIGPHAGRRCRGPGSELNELLVVRPSTRHTLRAIPSPECAAFSPTFSEHFWKGDHAVSLQSDRTGVRLKMGETAIAGSHGVSRMVSEGMPAGAIQIPPGGEPIILGPDHPTTGGYPVIACVAAVDLPRVGQLRPGDAVTFLKTSQAAALDCFRRLHSLLDTILPPT